METIISSIAAVLTTSAFIPQAYKIIHTRETKGVSLWMHITFAIGVAFWFTLGIMIWNWPMITASGDTFAAAVASFKLTAMAAGFSYAAHASIASGWLASAENFGD